MNSECALIAVSFALVFVTINGRGTYRDFKSPRETQQLRKDYDYRGNLKTDEEYRKGDYLFRPKRTMPHGLRNRGIRIGLNRRRDNRAYESVMRGKAINDRRELDTFNSFRRHPLRNVEMNEQYRDEDYFFRPNRRMSHDNRRISGRSQDYSWFHRGSNALRRQGNQYKRTSKIKTATVGFKDRIDCPFGSDSTDYCAPGCWEEMKTFTNDDGCHECHCFASTTICKLKCISEISTGCNSQSQCCCPRVYKVISATIPEEKPIIWENGPTFPPFPENGPTFPPFPENIPAFPPFPASQEIPNTEFDSEPLF